MTKLTIICGICGYRGQWNAEEWEHHYWRQCRGENNHIGSWQPLDWNGNPIIPKEAKDWSSES